MSDFNGSDRLSEERDPGLAEYLEIVRRRWPFFLVPLVVALGAAVGITLVIPPVYRGVATVTTDNALRLGVLDKLGDLSAFADQSGLAPDVDTVIELARSGAVRGYAADALASGLGDGARSAVRNLRVQQVRDSDVVSISVEHTDPRLAAEGANAIARSLIELSLTDRRRPVSEAREFINSQLTQEAQRLRESEDALVAFKDRNGDVALAEETKLNLQKLADLEAQAVDLRLEREGVRGQIGRARARLARQARISPTQWTPSPLIATLQRDLATLEIELFGLRREFTAQHPAVIRTQAKIQETRRRLDAELARSLQTYQYGVDPVYQELVRQIAQAEVAGAALDARAGALRGAIAQYESKVRGVPAREVGLARLTRTVQAAEKTYLLLTDKLQNAQIAEASIGSAIRLVDQAGVPSSPVRPRPVMNLLLALIVGAMAGAGAVFVREQLDDTVKSAEEVERLLGAPVLGVLPIIGHGFERNGHAPARAPHLVRLDGPSDAAEALRLLRTHVLMTAGGTGRCVLVTSALPREGKSTVAANLAVAISRMTRQVLLVNGDLRHPSLGALFPDSTSPGLAYFLTADVAAGAVVRSTVEPYLAYADSGAPPINPAELLSGPRAGRLITEAREHAEVVLIDSPPLLTVTDAELLARHADACLLVVRVGQTTRRALREARQRLERAGIPLAGVVLNFVPRGSRYGDNPTFGGYFDGNGFRGANGNGTEKPVGVPRQAARAGTSGRTISLLAFLVAASILGALAVAGPGRGWVAEAIGPIPHPTLMLSRFSRVITEFKATFWEFVLPSSLAEDDLQGER